jgi:hypothetical protein
MSAPLGKFDPEILILSCVDEVFYGGGKYTLAHHAPTQLTKIARRWIDFLLEFPVGLMFNVYHNVDASTVEVTLSAYGKEIIQMAGYSVDGLQLCAGNAKARDLAETKIKAALEIRESRATAESESALSRVKLYVPPNMKK